MSKYTYLYYGLYYRPAHLQQNNGLRNMNKGKLVTKFIFIIFLAFLFLYLFGYQSIRRYTEKNTFTETSSICSDLISPPAMTICNLESWKKIQSEQKRTFRYACGNTSDIYRCVEEKTLSRQQTIEQPTDIDRHE